MEQLTDLISRAAALAAIERVVAASKGRDSRTLVVSRIIACVDGLSATPPMIYPAGTRVFDRYDGERGTVETEAEHNAGVEAEGVANTDPYDELPVFVRFDNPTGGKRHWWLGASSVGLLSRETPK